MKDTARFKGGWGFFAIQGEAPAKQISYTAACYACHEARGAADTTRLGTLNPACVAERK